MIKYPVKNDSFQKYQQTKSQKILPILTSLGCFLLFGFFNIFYHKNMMDWSVKASEKIIEYDSRFLNL